MKNTVLKSALPTWSLDGKRVFLRADLNVPLKKQSLIDDYRLQRLRATLDYLIKHGATIILATHIGRPQKPEPRYSTRILLPWFTQHGYTVEHIENLSAAKTTKAPIVLLENMRFYPGEKTGDPAFARELAALADFYVNDAFGLMHRSDTSVTLVPELFRQEKRTIGFLVEQELAVLSQLATSPRRPYVVVIGGGKVATKLPVIKNLLGKADTILLCPAVVFTFLHAQGHNVGMSLIDESASAASTEILALAQQSTTNLVFPLDYQIARDSYDGPLEYVAAHEIPDNGIGASLGPKTRELFQHYFKNAQTLFINAGMGFPQHADTVKGLKNLLADAAKSSALCVIGGGTTVATARAAGLEKQFDFISTGGGATLAYLAGENLPGLKYWAKAQQ